MDPQRWFPTTTLAAIIGLIDIDEADYLRRKQREVLVDYSYTPEDVDNSEAGWSTDFAVAILAACYMTSVVVQSLLETTAGS